MKLSVLQKSLPRFQEISHPLGTLFWRGSSNYSSDRLIQELNNDRFPSDIRGNFSFIWVQEHSWVAAVDHLATYPIFYTDSAASNLFSDLLDTLPVKKQNERIIMQMRLLGGQSFFGDETTYCDIRRVCSGQYVKNGKAFPYIDYWSYLGDQPYEPSRFQELTEKVVSKSLASENTLLLSGGTDSTTLAGICRKLRVQEKVHYLHSYSPLQKNIEKNKVIQIANEMNLTVDYVPLSFTGDIDEAISRRQFSFWQENPFPGKRKSLELIGLTNTRIITGEIGDQLFGGPKNSSLLKYAWQVTRVNPEDVAKMWINLSESYGKSCASIPSRRVNDLRCFDTFSGVYSELVGAIADTFSAMKSKDYLNRILLLNYLIKGPYRVWAYSQDELDWVHPFADWELFDFCFRIPSHAKISNNGLQKWILLDAWREHLSDLPWRTKKNGFGVPTRKKFRPLSDFTGDRQSSSFTL
jgi:asparagine synthetase B (glutamine-hydrolysing)